jgi:phage tail-like protein
MGVKGTPRSFNKKFAFIVEIEGIEVAAFTKCSEISGEVAVVEQWEGGKLIPNKSPGKLTVSDVTLERGVAKGDSDLYEWWLQVVSGSANKGLVDDDYKRSVDVIQLDRDGSVIQRWTLDNAWPNKFVAGEWDNEADENLVESITLSYDSFDRFNS